MYRGVGVKDIGWAKGIFETRRKKKKQATGRWNGKRIAETKRRKIVKASDRRKESKGSGQQRKNRERKGGRRTYRARGGMTREKPRESLGMTSGGLD